MVHVVADDLGYFDTGWMQQQKHGHNVTATRLDELVASGVQLSNYYSKEYYTFKVCAPSRASILTGRYAWGVGFYSVGGRQPKDPARVQATAAGAQGRGGGPRRGSASGGPRDRQVALRRAAQVVHADLRLYRGSPRERQAFCKTAIDD